MENVSGVGRMNIGADQAQASQVERGGVFEWISKVWKAIATKKPR
jgi:hypothetical protein